MIDGMFSRTERLIGRELLEELRDQRVIIFGIGGVGSWCVESLVRTGIGHLTIVDPDRVSVSNINRQLPATIDTIGRLKTEVLKERMLSLNPDVEITVRNEGYSWETADSFNLDDYDYIIDAIDTLRDKALLIKRATATKKVFYSSMGASLKLDSTRIKVGEFRKVQGCPLARALRNRFKKEGIWPSRKFLCVYSDELLENKGEEPKNESNGMFDSRKAVVNGSVMHITAIFGLTLAGLVIKNILEKPRFK